MHTQPTQQEEWEKEFEDLAFSLGIWARESLAAISFKNFIRSHKTLWQEEIYSECIRIANEIGQGNGIVHDIVDAIQSKINSLK